MIIKILGSGCANCKKTKEIVKKAIADLSLEAQVEEVTEIADIMSYGVMSTPGLVIDEKVVGSGGVPSYQQVVDLLVEAQV
jgi:small redox-active disulfide protein 2